jgi:hypothetical protein
MVNSRPAVQDSVIVLHRQPRAEAPSPTADSRHCRKSGSHQIATQISPIGRDWHSWHNEHWFSGVDRRASADLPGILCAGTLELRR